MGTRSLTYVYGDDGFPITCMYRQFDGYPTGHGQELAEFLLGRKLVNGIPTNNGQLKISNGMNDLAAQLVCHFKSRHDVGGIYLYRPDNVGADYWQEYEYHIYEHLIAIYNDNCKVPNSCIFNGTWEEFENYCSTERYGEKFVSSFENSLIGQEVLKKELKEGIVTVVFKKQDGTERTMRCTLSDDYVPLLDTNGVASKRAKNPDVLAVWDTDANGWRSFRFDSVKSIAYPSVV